MKLRILLVDDHKIFCEGLRAVIEKEPDMEVVGTAIDGRDAVRLATALTPDVVVIDIAMPGLNGIEATKMILKDHPGTKVIALSMHTDRRFVEGMLTAGAAGYLVKECAAEELARAIQTAIGGKVYLSPEITEIVVAAFTRAKSEDVHLAGPQLSTREREILQLLAEGKSARDIGRTLHISVKTVESHRRAVMEKLDLHSVAELTKYAIREGITALND